MSNTYKFDSYKPDMHKNSNKFEVLMVNAQKLNIL